ncbi:hypothetical protein CTAYLR_008134 [Chrysophaeum taylorii]|uniref:PPM-type phosphatase domain-containing protein n=1 Tax=Chrysophaeum taylorii TaxID=2483200 RepID=A0AAD7XLP4_9STRA|nr:hypothetical protein CTAYLR_008134 [Chrysophaeum taylorii]
MGAYLSEPVTTKETEEGTTASLRFGCSSMQGWRRTMEDAHILGAAIEDGSLFGVFDGHGGAEVARFVSRRMAREIRWDWRSDPEAELKRVFHRMDDLLRDPRFAPEIDSLKNAKDSAEQPQQEQRVSAKEALEIFQQMIQNNASRGDAAGDAPQRRRCELPDHPLQAGCTAVVVVFDEGSSKLWCANAGDSRAVVCRDRAAVPLSFDHKPCAPGEQARITNAGGFVDECANGFFRVNGNLNLSRSIGDLKYKGDASLDPSQQIITAEPDVVECDVQPEDTFIIIACDGVWDVVSNQEAVDFVNVRLHNGHHLPGAPEAEEGKKARQLSAICEELLDHCLATNPRESRGIGGDNMTCIIIQFKRS